LLIGIVLLPFIFAWFTLRKGYSKNQRFLALGWMVIVFVSVRAGNRDKVDSATESASAYTAAAQPVPVAQPIPMAPTPDPSGKAAMVDFCGRNGQDIAEKIDPATGGLSYHCIPRGEAPATSAPATTASTPPPPPAAPARYVRHVDANELWNDYRENEVAADERYKGHVLIVDGVVASIDKDFLDHIVIRLKSRNEFMGTMATMEDAEKRTAASLRRGQRVLVQCRGGTMIMGSPTLEDCTFR